MHDRTGFTPFVGRKVKGWPERVILRGREIVDGGGLLTSPGSGQWLKRRGGWAAEPSGRLTSDMNPASNFGASLL
jgi:dihydropyrimidinase